MLLLTAVLLRSVREPGDRGRGAELVSDLRIRHVERDHVQHQSRGQPNPAATTANTTPAPDAPVRK